MDDKKYMTLIDEDGKETKYEILLTFKWKKTNKNYIVYTDNTYDENSNLKVYAAIYYPDDDSKLDSVETEEEWDQIKSMLDNM